MHMVLVSLKHDIGDTCSLNFRSNNYAIYFRWFDNLSEKNLTRCPLPTSPT